MSNGPPLFLLLLLLLLAVLPARAEVVSSLADCEGFLLDEIPPVIPNILEGGNILDQNRYKPICQTYGCRRRFVTLYDTANKIPVFSAYRYRGQGGGKRPDIPWMIEPQLESTCEGKNMQPRNMVCHNQAKNRDYSGSGMDRGHLFPSLHAFLQDDKNSTFTLTNIVPQAGTFNKGSWSRMETCLKCVMDRFCIDNNGQVRAFVVTGALPSVNNFLNKVNNKRKQRINVPAHLWSAFCCYSHGEQGWLASAHWAHNVPDRDQDHNVPGNQTKQFVQTQTLAQLQRETGTIVFPGTRCPLHTTVSRFYPQLNSENNNCKCPPFATTTVGPSTTDPDSATPSTEYSTASTMTTHPITTFTSSLSAQTTTLHTTPPTTITKTTTSTSTKKKEEEEEEEEQEQEQEQEQQEGGQQDVGGEGAPGGEGIQGGAAAGGGTLGGAAAAAGGGILGGAAAAGGGILGGAAAAGGGILGGGAAAGGGILGGAAAAGGGILGGGAAAGGGILGGAAAAAAGGGGTVGHQQTTNLHTTPSEQTTTRHTRPWEQTTIQDHTYKTLGTDQNTPSKQTTIHQTTQSEQTAILQTTQSEQSSILQTTQSEQTAILQTTPSARGASTVEASTDQHGSMSTEALDPPEPTQSPGPTLEPRSTAGTPTPQRPSTIWKRILTVFWQYLKM